MMETASAAGVKLMVGHKRRLRPQYAKMSQVVRSGRLGRVMAVNINGFYHRDWWSWWLRRDRGGGLLHASGVPRHRFSAAHLWRGGERVRQKSREDGSSKRFRRPDLDADPLRIGRGGHAAGQPLLSDLDLSPVLRRTYRAGAGRSPLRSRRLQRLDPEPRRLGGAASSSTTRPASGAPTSKS